jgi:hypothetical protein
MELDELIKALESDDQVKSIQENVIQNRMLKNMWVNYKDEKWFPYLVKDQKTHSEGFDFNNSGNWGKNESVGRSKISFAELLARVILGSYESKAAVRCKTNQMSSGNERHFSEISYDKLVESIVNRYLNDQKSKVSRIEKTNYLVDDELENATNNPSTDGVAGSNSFQIDPEKRKCIELFAEDLAVKHYQSQGFTVEKKGKPFDLLCTKGELTIHVEAKGTVGYADKVILTRNEVIDARNKTWRSDLFVVYGIKLNQVEQAWQASDGVVKLIENWEPKDADLQAINFEYTVP